MKTFLCHLFGKIFADILLFLGKWSKSFCFYDICFILDQCPDGILSIISSIFPSGIAIFGLGKCSKYLSIQKK